MQTSNWTLAVEANTPTNGDVAVAHDGTITYTPNPDFYGQDSFSYTLHEKSDHRTRAMLQATATATVQITVMPVNDAPSFIGGQDQIVIDDAVTQTVAGWATNLFAGANNENDQELTFHVTVISTTGNLAFAELPAIDTATGDLTYTPADDTSGVATVQVILQDNGGTENGGIDTSPPEICTITYNPAPTAITLRQFNVVHNTTGTEVRWTTGIEHNTWGFHILRSASEAGAEAVRITDDIILARGQGGSGAAYQLHLERDTDASLATTYTYWLEEYELDGSVSLHGPATTMDLSANPISSTFLPLVLR